jgi:16S rRNA (adenine(1408)-N(1))-methyltransferase
MCPLPNGPFPEPKYHNSRWRGGGDVIDYLPVRVLQGKRTVEAPASWRDELPSGRVVIDVGAGDGRYVYDCARLEPGAVFVAVDPDADTLAEYAFRASRKPARGGAANARFVVAAVEDLPAQLHGLADVIRVNFPWGGLLRGLALPERHVLDALARLAAPHARFEIVFSYDPVHDLAGLAGQTLPPLTEAYIDLTLAPAYAAAGLQIETRRQMTAEEALAIASTWGRRLLHARNRDVFWLEGSVTGQPQRPGSANLGARGT